MIPGVIALVRYKKITGSYYPFLYCLWLGCLNELLNNYLILNGYQTLINNNIYVLAESLFLIGYFQATGLFKKARPPIILTLSLLVVWITETLIIKSITVNSTYFRIFYSLMIVFLSTNLVTQILFTHKKSLIKDARFLLSIAFIFYFAYKALVQAFVIYGISRNSTFLLNIYIIMIYVNFFVNLVYALAILWMPRKIKYSLPSSLQS